jgi:hypothetical protein
MLKVWYVVLLSPRAAHHPEYPTVLTALEIDNAVVANSLIDMRSIETVLLIKVRPTGLLYFTSVFNVQN